MVCFIRRRHKAHRQHTILQHLITLRIFGRLLLWIIVRLHRTQLMRTMFPFMSKIFRERSCFFRANLYLNFLVQTQILCGILKQTHIHLLPYGNNREFKSSLHSLNIQFLVIFSASSSSMNLSLSSTASSPHALLPEHLSSM